MYSSANSTLANSMDETEELFYKFPDAEQSDVGACIHISGSGILFITGRHIESGLALEVNMAKQSVLNSSLIAYVEVLSSTKVGPEKYEVETIIKGIKEK